jgi:hypothetical protein
MAAPLVLGGIAAASSLFNLITGVGQKRKAKRALNEFNALQEERPVYETPEAALNALSILQQQYADPNMPGQQVAMGRADQNFANVVSAGAQAGNPFAALVGAQSQADAANQNIMTQSASYQDQQRNQYLQGLQMMAGYQDQEWQMNQFAPWADASQFQLNEYRDFRQAGNRNIASGIDGLSTFALSMLAPGLGATPNPGTPNMTGLQSVYQRYTAPQTNQLPPAPY